MGKLYKSHSYSEKGSSDLEFGTLVKNQYEFRSNLRNLEHWNISTLGWPLGLPKEET